MADNLILRNCRILFRNFSGREGRFNEAGKRNFCVIIDDPAMVQRCINEGWNVRALTPRDPQDDVTHYIPVKVMFGRIPPKIHMITRKNDILLDEESISQLDYAEIKKVDLEIRPYNWDETHISAYAKTMYVTIEEDVFADDYHPEETAPWY